MVNPVDLVKKASVDAVEEKGPVKLLFGTVISASPLQIQVDQKSTYSGGMLVLTRNVTDHFIDVDVAMKTEKGKHKHKLEEGTTKEEEIFLYIRNRKKILVHNALVAGDQVLLARMQGGKKFVVIDRIKPIPRLSGEWV